MIEIEHLRVADFYAWLGCQAIAASQLGCNQSTVSRRARQAGRLAATRGDENQVDFLSLERRIHQRWRFAKACDLRLHAYRWTNQLLQRALPGPWLLNPVEVSVTPTSPLQLLERHVIDALLAPWPVVAELDHDQFALVPVLGSPLVLLAPSGSALVAETGLSAADIGSLSRLGQFAFVPPAASDCSQHLDAQLFGSADSLPGMGALQQSADGPGSRAQPPVPAAIANPALPERYWGMPLTPLIRPDLVMLPYPMPVSYAGYLVCRKEWRHHVQISHLLDAIRRALAFQQRDGAGLEMLAIA